MRRPFSRPYFVAALAAFMMLSGIGIRAQDTEYRVFIFQGDLTTDFYTLLFGEVVEAAESAEATEPPTEAEEAQPGEAETEAAEAGTAESADAAEPAGAEAEPTVALPEDFAPPEWIDGEQVVEAVLQSALLRGALEAPLEDGELWRQEAKKPVGPGRGAMHREGAIIAVDSKLRIKQLETDLTDHIITAVEAMSAPAQAAAPAKAPNAAAALAGKIKAVLNLLDEELASDDPSAAMIDALLRRLANLHEAAAAMSAAAATTDQIS